MSKLLPIFNSQQPISLLKTRQKMVENTLLPTVTLLMAIDLHVPEKRELRAENALQASSCSPQFFPSQPCVNWFQLI